MDYVRLRDVHLDHVQLAAPAGCEEDARSFYGGVLGLREIPKPEPLSQRGGVWFAVNASQQLHIGVEESFAPAGKAHPALSVGTGELEQLAVRLAEAGTAVTWDEAIPSVRRFYVADPWGNRLEFLTSGPAT